MLSVIIWLVAAPFLLLIVAVVWLGFIGLLTLLAGK